jgi:hypothetical protein
LSQEGLLLARAVHNRKEITDALATAGHRAREQNHLAQALIYYHESLEHHQALDTTSGVAACLEGLAMVLLTSRQPTTGVRLWGAASALREARGTPLPPFDRQGHQRALAAARLEVGAKEFDAAWAMGTALTPRSRLPWKRWLSTETTCHNLSH